MNQWDDLWSWPTRVTPPCTTLTEPALQHNVLLNVILCNFFRSISGPLDVSYSYWLPEAPLSFFFVSSTTVRCGLWISIQFSSISDGHIRPVGISIVSSSQQICFTGLGCQPNAQPLTWRTRVSLLVLNLTLDLSGLGDPASSYASAGIALEITGARKPHRHDKAETPLPYH
jgi:hypothetical protein